MKKTNETILQMLTLLIKKLVKSAPAIAEVHPIPQSCYRNSNLEFQRIATAQK